MLWDIIETGIIIVLGVSSIEYKILQDYLLKKCIYKIYTFLNFIFIVFQQNCLYP